MDDLSRSEYPALLARLQPAQATAVVNDRIRRISTLNTEIASWLQERQKVEEQYVAGLKRLVQFRVPNQASELGIFQSPWDRILKSTESVAASHHVLAQHIERDGDLALRNFQASKEFRNMQTVAGNLASIAKEVEEAQAQSDKITKKGTKSSATKADSAASKLESASSQWDSQAPFIFETLQALDERRCNYLRDVLTQLQTHDLDNSDRLRNSANEALGSLLEINTDAEIQNFARRAAAGRPKLEPKRSTAAPQPPTRQSSSLQSDPTPPPTATSQPDDNASDYSATNEKSESKLRSRLGTMLGRRRQSTHGGFGQLSSSKTASTLGRGSSSHGAAPQLSLGNLGTSSSRLGAVAETPDSPVDREQSADNGDEARSNGLGTNQSNLPPPRSSSHGGQNRIPQDVLDAPPPPGPPPSHKATNPTETLGKDDDGFTVRAPMDDPITAAQKEAAAEDGSEGAFKVNIQQSPVAEEDPEASKAAMSNVANTLNTMSQPPRKNGTVRGRRDVRNTMYMPATTQLAEVAALGSIGEATERLPALSPMPGAINGEMPRRPSAAQHALASDRSVAGTSDSQSIRSAGSAGGRAHGQHPETTASGLSCSLVETISASFDNGVPKSIKIAGEIAFANNGDNAARPGHEIIRINDFANLESIGPNRIFVTSTSAPGEYSLDLSHIPAKNPTPGFTYRVHADDSTSDKLTDLCPILLKPVWKPSGDKLGLLLQYKANPDARFVKSGSLQIKNLLFMATYEDARASGVQTKPAGTHLKEKHLVYWRVGDVTLSATDDWQKIVCRIIGAENAEPKPGVVEARWEIVSPAGDGVSEDKSGGVGGASGISISKQVEDKGKGKIVEEEEDDPFADEAGGSTPKPKEDEHSWVNVPLSRKVVSGQYQAK